MGTGGVARLKFVAANHAFVGNRLIEGKANGAQIVIGSGVTLRSEATIAGKLQIVKFENDGGGVVTAIGTAGTLLVAPYELAGHGFWRAQAGGTLVFSDQIVVANTLGGGFSFPDTGTSTNTIVVNKELTSTGALFGLLASGQVLEVNENLTLGSDSGGIHCDFDAGTIKVKAGKRFRHY